MKRNLEERIHAIFTRNHLEKEEILKRIDSQIDYDGVEFAKRIQQLCVWLIENNGTMEQLRSTIDNILTDIQLT